MFVQSIEYDANKDVIQSRNRRAAAAAHIYILHMKTIRRKIKNIGDDEPE